MSFGQRLKKERRSRDLTRKELASRTRGAVSDHSIQSYEQGRRTLPRYEKVAALAKALSVQPEDLAG